METRIYCIDLNKTNSIPPFSNNKFMTIAEEQGKVWSLKGFENDFNSNEISDEWLILINNTKN
jgi:hypothetical protein